jgi:hypothetical protein
MIQISHVPTEYINSCWKDVEGYLKKALDYTNGRYEIEDLYLALHKYDHHLWIAFDENEIKGAVVTHILVYPRKRFLCMAFCGGKELDIWKDEMIVMLKNFAIDMKCDGLEATGRKGWAKALKSHGHEFLWDTFELPLE